MFASPTAMRGEAGKAGAMGAEGTDASACLERLACDAVSDAEEGDGNRCGIRFFDLAEWHLPVIHVGFAGGQGRD